MHRPNDRNLDRDVARVRGDEAFAPPPGQRPAPLPPRPPTEETRRQDGVLKVSRHSRPQAVAGAVAGAIRQDGQAELQAIGAGAVNQAIKAIAIARRYLHAEGLDLYCMPSFIDVTIEAAERTVLRLEIEPRAA